MYKRQGHYRISQALKDAVRLLVCGIFHGYGLETSLLERSGADIAYVMPSHQYPTGIVMPVKRRQELLSLSLIHI